VSVGPRLGYHRVARSKATPPVDEQPVPDALDFRTCAKSSIREGVSGLMVSSSVACRL